VPMHTVRPGELFAEASIFSAHYHCDAIALRDCEVLVYPKAELTRQLKESKDELWAFTAELAHRVQGLRTRLEVRQIRSAPERVLQSLRLRCDSSGTWKVDGTLKQFAEEVGLTHEALYRALATLERDGSIVRGKHEITLLTHVMARHARR
jgi:CRP-like cAMP-binding protein